VQGPEFKFQYRKKEKKKEARLITSKKWGPFFPGYRAYFSDVAMDTDRELITQ
jgi:hypothetical protein